VIKALEAKQVVVKRESVLIWIKDISDLTVLPLASAVQSYAEDAKKKHDAFCSFRNQKSDYEVTIALVLPKDNELDKDLSLSKIFWTLIPSVQSISYDFSAMKHDTFDAIFDLSEEHAREIGQPTQRHLAQSYGVMLGSNANSFPHSVENLCKEFTPSGKILSSLEFKFQVDYFPSSPIGGHDRYLYRDASDGAFPLSISSELSLEQRIKNVFECDGVIDTLSFESYLASCLGKPVLELSNDSAMTQWSNPKYCRMEKLTKEGFERGLKQCFPQLLDHA